MDVLSICRMVARSVMSEIGPWGDRCALFGGLAPSLLMPDRPDALAPHVGTRDVDLAIRVAAIGDAREMYRTLRNNLAALGLRQRGDRSFEWTRTIDQFEATVELFVPVDTPEQGGRIQQKPIEHSGSGLTALGLYGLDLVDRDLVLVDDEGPLLDGRGVKRTRLRVCGPAMLVALKAWALNDRNKTRDGYDVMWLLSAYGVEALAARFQTAGIGNSHFGSAALQYLEECFQTHEHTGPVGWVIEAGFMGDERERQARDASGAVREFVRLARGRST